MISLNNKKFTVMENSSSGEVGNNTIFEYYEDEQCIYADYYGGDIYKGHLLGKRLDGDYIEFFYHHLNQNNELKIGKCKSRIIINSDNNIVLDEIWEWLCDDFSTGTSLLEEVK